MIDTDGDLRPDCHLGISNENATTGEPVDHHVWLKNLRTGIEDDRVGGPYGYPFDVVHLGEKIPDGVRPPLMQFSFLGGSPMPCDDYGPGDHYYAYSSPDRGRSGDVLGLRPRRRLARFPVMPGITVLPPGTDLFLEFS